jgi:hypothetical protein
MSGQDEAARLFQRVVMFKYVSDDNWPPTTKEILVSRAAIAQYEVRRLKSNHCQTLSYALT